MNRTRIVGTGQYLPEKIVTNRDLEKLMDTNDEWIRQRTGIAQRHIAEKGTGSADIGAPAAQKALDAAGIEPGEVDLIVACTCTPDHIFPSTSCLIQAKLGARRAAAIDVNAACTGFVYGLSIADAMIRTGVYRNAIVVGAEVLSNHLNWNKRDTAVLFGDGAGAVVLQACEDGDTGVLSTNLCADGSAGDLLYMKAGGSKEHITAENVNSPDRDITMNGRDLFKKAVVLFGEAAQTALDRAGHTIDELDLFVPHQANTRIIYSATQRVGIPDEKVYVNIDRVANTVAASIPLALDDAVKEGRLKPGDLVMLAAFGAGLTWGAALVRW
jgi:3-oxoacyl-[acyl-carrier-protein] synthase-3